MASVSVQDSGFHSFDGKKGNAPTSPSFPLMTIFIALVMILLGVFSGYFLSQRSVSGVRSNSASLGTSGASGLKPGDVIGSNDTSTFKDSAEGVLQEGGINSEGQFHLVRPGGDSQNVYLTSSSVDLSQFLKRKIKVWGATQTAKTAGWLMDVGRVEVLE